jgi:hypothetical protein
MDRDNFTFAFANISKNLCCLNMQKWCEILWTVSLIIIGQTCTTVGEEKHYNPRLTKPLDEFVNIMENLNLPYPKMMGKCKVVKLLFVVYFYV